MPVDFNMLLAAPTVAARFAEGQESARQEADRNLLRQVQMETLAGQRETRALEAEKRRQDLASAAARKEFLTNLGTKMAEGGHKLSRESLSSMMQFGMQYNQKDLTELAVKGLQALDEEEQFQSERSRLGLPGAAPAAPAAPTGEGAVAMPVAPTLSQAGPANMLSPSPAAAPAPSNALVSREQIQNMLMSSNPRIRKMAEEMLKVVGTPQLVETKLKDGMVLRQSINPVTGETRDIVAYEGRDPHLYSPEAQAQRVAASAAGATKVINAGQTSYAQTIGKGAGESDLALHATITAAPEMVRKIDETLDILRNQDINTGLGAELFTVLDKAKAQFLADKNSGKRVTSTEYLDSLLGSEVFPQIQALGIGARGMDTPAEREFLRKVMTGSITLDRGTLVKMAELRRKSVETAVERYNERVDKGELDAFFQHSNRVKSKVTLPEAPKADATKPAARTVVKTGRDASGRRVVQYSDGTIDYAPN